MGQKRGAMGKEHRLSIVGSSPIFILRIAGLGWVSGRRGPSDEDRFNPQESLFSRKKPELIKNNRVANLEKQMFDHQ
jgi:hypothetical protein